MELPIDELDAALFATATRVTMRNGQKASFWLSSWINGQAPTAMHPLLYSHSRRKNRTVSEALTSGTWIDNIAHDLTPELLNEYFKLWRAIEVEDVDLDDARDDLIVWTLESSDEYTARSAHIIQFEGQIKSNFPKLIWKAWATPRCKFFL
jgi:hypothetical protein